MMIKKKVFARKILLSSIFPLLGAFLFSLIIGLAKLIIYYIKPINFFTLTYNQIKVLGRKILTKLFGNH